MSCKVLFASLPTGEKVAERAALIDSAKPDGYCEAESVSDFSPGPVTGEEHLHRYVFSPIHLHEGLVVPAFFNDAKDKGLSCERGSSSSPIPEIHDRGKAQVQSFNGRRQPSQPERGYVGTVTATVDGVRKIVIEGKRVFAVYDTALSDNAAHVDVFEIADRTKAQKKLARLALAGLFTNVPVTS